MSKYLVVFIENGTTESGIKETVKDMVAGGDKLLTFSQAMKRLTVLSGDYKYGFYQMVDVVNVLKS
jgi:hypothetical protein